MLFRRGSRSSSSAQPTTLSTALSRPTSSRSTRISPPAPSNWAATCSPPVSSKTACTARSCPAKVWASAAAMRIGSSRTRWADWVRTASVPALPHSPHELVVENDCSRLGSGDATPGARVTSSTLYVAQSLAGRARARAQRSRVLAAGDDTLGHEEPGSKVGGVPGRAHRDRERATAHRISSGSSTASSSCRTMVSSPTVTRMTRRRAVILLIRAVKSAVTRDRPGAARPVRPAGSRSQSRRERCDGKGAREHQLAVSTR